MNTVCAFFFFQAEDGIRDRTVTGVQTCALPISRLAWGNRDAPRWHHMLVAIKKKTTNIRPRRGGSGVGWGGDACVVLVGTATNIRPRRGGSGVGRRGDACVVPVGTATNIRLRRVG